MPPRLRAGPHAVTTGGSWPRRAARVLLRRKWILCTASVALATAMGCCSCIVNPRPVAVPEGDGPAAVLASGTLVSPLHVMARHAWFALRDEGDATWERWEIWYPDSGECWGYVCRRTISPLASVGEGGVRVHSVLQGDEAKKMIACLRRESPRYRARFVYLPWPGPNSNTFVDALLRECGWKADLPATAIGKDYRGFLGASLTSGGTGLQIETPLVGLKVGATEGLEIHILALTFGIDWYPFALKVPGGSGRVGWEDR